MIIGEFLSQLFFERTQGLCDYLKIASINERDFFDKTFNTSFAHHMSDVQYVEPSYPLAQFKNFNFSNTEQFFMGADSSELLMPRLLMQQHFSCVLEFVFNSAANILAQHEENKLLQKFTSVSTPEKISLLRTVSSFKIIHNNCKQDYNNPNYLEDVISRGASFKQLVEQINTLEQVVDSDILKSQKDNHGFEFQAFKARNAYVQTYCQIFNNAYPDYLGSTEYHNLNMWQTYQIGILKLLDIRDNKRDGTRVEYDRMTGFLDALACFEDWDVRQVKQKEIDFWQPTLDKFLNGTYVYLP